MTGLRLEDFATDRHPLHCSRLPVFMGCPWKTVMEHLGIYNRDGGTGAQTGSVVHKGVQTWHTNGGKEDSAVAAMKGLRVEFPLADFTEAEQLFRLYIADQRNQTAEIARYAGKALIEVLFHSEIAPGVVLEGTTDQIRVGEDGVWEIWDLKTSKEPGAKIRDFHLYQIAAYAVLATKRYKRTVRPGGIIMARGYEARTGASRGWDKVWFPYTQTHEDAVRLMANVADRVKDVREGRLHPVPGENCLWCIGVPLCLSKLKTYEEKQHGEREEERSCDDCEAR